MNTEQDFKCIFCDETFCDKEEFQIHFRKHGDPGFNQKKRRFTDEKHTSNESAKEAVEMVECDVCPEVFTSISKAITHKHKLHPDHAGKYFCPWCGKLFTMKYLFNKHLTTDHPDMEKKDDKIFHCDMCDVDFNIPAAMLYHNKFFHRQDTDMPSIGTSKKLKMYNQEVIMISICPFCGEEFDNKVNLHKHITDDHSDENQSPDSVFRCPLCDAIFYHLDAYQLHLMHHSIDDLYSERSEMADLVTDFSFESVPPITEKVENVQPEETPENVMGIEQLLELSMNDDEPQSKKQKKHKKHKKSKKSAITLDEFLNMNKDVFGEEIDFQGIEEVPTPVVAKKLKTNKKAIPLKSTPDIEKLKKQGIVVKKNRSNIGKKMIIKRPIDFQTTVNTQQSKSNTNTPDEVISKFLKLPNSQIKIVKKPSKDSPVNKEEDTGEEQFDDNTHNTAKPENSELTDSIATEENEGGSKAENVPESEPVQQKSTAEITETNDEQEEIDFEKQIDEMVQSPKNDEELSDVNNGQNNVPGLHNETNTDESSNVTKSIVLKQKDVEDANDSEHDDLTDNENANDIANNHSEDEAKTSSENNKSKTLEVLKNLSHLTVKSMSPAKTILKPKETIVNRCAVSNTLEQDKKEGRNSPKPLKIANIINKTTELEENEGLQDKKVLENKTETTNKLKIQNIKQLKTPLIMEAPKESLPQKDIEQPSVNLLKHLKNITAKPVNAKNVNPDTPKPVISKNLNPGITKVPQKVINMKNIIKKQVNEQNIDNIEVFNIDDSEDEEMNNTRTEKPMQIQNENSNKSLNVLKNIFKKNITIKSLKPNGNVPKGNILKKEIKTEVEDDFDEEFDNPDVTSGPQAQHKQSIVNNVLKHLSKNITVKSAASSPVAKPSVHHDEGNESPDPESDTDSHPGTVKFKDVTDMSDEELDDYHDIDNNTHQNPKVKHPDDSDSEKEEHHSDEAFNDPPSDDDFDDPIDSHLLKKPSNSVSNQNLDTLKKISKDITIKSSTQLSKNNTTNSNDIAQMGKKLTQQISNKNQGNNRMQSRSINELVNQQNMSSTNSKEVKTVKTLKTQTETVIEEVTTTITKTIKTVNQTNQVVRNQCGPSNIRPHITSQIRPQQRSYQGMKVRQATPVTPRPRIRNPNAPLSRPTFNTRSPNQIISVRPALMAPQSKNPRFINPPTIRPPQSSPQNQIRKPIKLSPNAIVKRPNVEETSHFSCFKKPKESLIPELPMAQGERESAVHFSSVQMNKSNYSCTTKSVKGNSVVMSSQIKSETSASSQQLSKLRNMSGLSVVKTNQVKQCHVEEKSENIANRTTLAAIQKLQSQGLLVKKPRISVSEESEHSNPCSDNEGQFSNEEYDE